MMHQFLYIVIGVCILTQFVYLFVKFYYEHRARKKLEKKLRAHKHIYQKYRNDLSTQNLKDLSDYEHDILLTFLKEEINKLHNKRYKDALNKTLNQKSSDNQRRFASRLMHESGLEKLMPRELVH